MKCPHCSKTVGWFKGMKRDRSVSGKHKTYICPACDGLVQRYFHWRLFALLFPAALVAALAITPQLDAAGLGHLSGIVNGLLAASACTPCLRLKAATPP
jgi:hypothetical protein